MCVPREYENHASGMRYFFATNKVLMYQKDISLSDG